MTLYLSHFLIGLSVSLGISWLAFRLGPAGSTSLSVAPVIVGLACGAMALYLSPWATPPILALYALVTYLELRRDLPASGEASRKE